MPIPYAAKKLKQAAHSEWLLTTEKIMTFNEWLKQHPKVSETLTQSDISLVEMGWLAAKTDSYNEAVETELQRVA